MCAAWGWRLPGKFFINCAVKAEETDFAFPIAENIEKESRDFAAVKSLLSFPKGVGTGYGLLAFFQ